jgi:hypothetical protein
MKICSPVIESFISYTHGLFKHSISQTIPFTNPFPDNSILVDLPSGLIGCSLPMVYTYYMNKSFREFLPNTGLYLDSTANGGGGTVQYKIKIYYKRRLISL